MNGATAVGINRPARRPREGPGPRRGKRLHAREGAAFPGSSRRDIGAARWRGRADTRAADRGPDDANRSHEDTARALERGGATDAAPDTGPVILGRYRLKRRLGAGAFGSVWQARDEHLHREVAVKLLPRERIAGGRFEREARAAARLAHPGIVTLYEAEVDDEGAYLVSELVRGPTLDRLLADGELSDRGIVRIGIALCDALAHAHAEGVVHRDVKPSNILVPRRPTTAAGLAKLTDFGVARLIGGNPLTRTGDVIGTAAYMAPEQAEGRPAEAAADLYSLALVLYEALTGVNPLANAPRTRRLGTYLPPLRRQRRDLPRALGQAIDTALRPRARERGTIDELKSALERCLDELDDRAGTVAAPRVWRREEAPAGGTPAASPTHEPGAPTHAAPARTAPAPRLGWARSRRRHRSRLRRLHDHARLRPPAAHPDGRGAVRRAPRGDPPQARVADGRHRHRRRARAPAPPGGRAHRPRRARPADDPPPREPQRLAAPRARPGARHRRARRRMAGAGGASADTHAAGRPRRRRLALAVALGSALAHKSLYIYSAIPPPAGGSTPASAAGAHVLKPLLTAGTIGGALVWAVAAAVAAARARAPALRRRAPSRSSPGRSLTALATTIAAPARPLRAWRRSARSRVSSSRLRQMSRIGLRRPTARRGLP